MKTRVTLLALGAMLIGCSQADTPTPGHTSGLDVSNLRVGLVCPENRSICVETTQIMITGQGRCVYNGEELPCTWYGFEFDYARAQPGDQISCVVTSDHSADFGDPSGVRQESANQIGYQLPLDGSAGHFFNPQYTIYEPNAAGRAAVQEETICSIGERELFKFQMNFQFPG